MKAIELSLSRFIEAQDGCFEIVLEELHSQKRNHWIWFIFPQLKALGRSKTAKYFGINGIVEAKAYIDNEILKNRLIICLETLLKNKQRSPNKILGAIDAMKLRSCITLFLIASEDRHLNKILEKVKFEFYDGCICFKTKEILES